MSDESQRSVESFLHHQEVPISKRIGGPNSRFKSSLAEFVSLIVNEDIQTESSFREGKDLFPFLGEAVRVEDWEKVLNDDANYQFSDIRRPLVEAILNATDSIARREALEGGWFDEEDFNKRVEVEVKDGSFVVRDFAEGMNANNLITLLTPKLTENEGDLVIGVEDLVGQFGVGFYSLIGLLREKDDLIILRTTDGSGGGQRISISKNFNDPNYPEGRLTITNVPIKKYPHSNRQSQNDFITRVGGRGTEVLVKSKLIQEDSFTNYVADTLEYFPGVSIEQNGEVVNNKDGLTEERVTIVSEKSHEVEKATIQTSENTGDRSQVCLLVAGVKVETFEIEGAQLPEKMVINLPPSTRLPKSRDKVEVTTETLKLFEKIVDTTFWGVSSSLQKQAGKISALYEIVNKIQDRNPKVEKRYNLIEGFRRKYKDWASMHEERLGVIFLPYSSELSAVELNQVVQIDQRLQPMSREIPGLDKIKELKGFLNITAYWASFSEKDRLLAVAGKTIFLNSNLQNPNLTQIAMINSLLKVYDESKDLKDRLDVSFAKPEREYQVSTSGKTEKTPSLDEGLPPRNRTQKLESTIKLKSSENGFVFSFDDPGKNAQQEAFHREQEEQETLLNEKLDQMRSHRDTLPKSREELLRPYLEKKVILKIIDELQEEDSQGLMKESFLYRYDFWEGLFSDEFIDQLPDLLFDSQEELEAYFLDKFSEKFRTELLLNKQDILKQLGRDKFNVGMFRNIWENILISTYRKSSSLQDSDNSAVVQALGLISLDNLKADQKDLIRDSAFIEQLVDPHNQDIWQLLSILEKTEVGKNEDFIFLERITERTTGESPILQYRDYEGSRPELGVYLEWCSSHANELLQLYYQVDPELDIYLSEAVRMISQLGGNFDEHIAQFNRNFHQIRELRFLNPQIDSYFRNEIAPEYLFTIVMLEKPANVDTLRWLADNNISFVRFLLVEPYLSLPPDQFEKMYHHFIYLSEVPEIFDSGTSLLFKTKPEFFSLLDTNDFSRTSKRVDFLNELPPHYGHLFYQLWHRCMPPIFKVTEQKDEFQRLSNLYEDRLITIFERISALGREEADKVILQLEEAARTIKFGQIEKTNEIGLLARPWTLYLVGDMVDSSKGLDSSREFEIADPDLALSGTDLLGLYLSTEETNQSESFDHLGQLYQNTQIKDRARKLARRRLEHAVNYQSSDSYIWLRELIQNSYNASRAEGVPQKVDIQSRAELDQVVISVRDYAGMTPNQIINNLLITQRSEWASSDALGYFGHGFFTLFREAKEATIVSSVGDGLVTEVQVVPNRQVKNGREVVVDLDYKMRTYTGDFKGTEVTWKKESEVSDLEVHMARSHAEKYAGLMPKEALEISWGDELINAEMEVLSAAETRYGKVTFYKSPGINALTKDGLFVKQAGADTKQMMVRVSRDLLDKVGVTIDLGTRTPLIDSRADIAQKEQVFISLEPVVADASVKILLDLFGKGSIDLSQIPTDIYINGLNYQAQIPDYIRTDIQKLVQGEQIDDWQPYIHSEEATLQLMFSLPTFEHQSQKLSLYDVVTLSEINPEILDILPKFLKESILSARRMNETALYNKDEEFRRLGHTKYDLKDLDTLPPEADILRLWAEIYDGVIFPAVETSSKQFTHATYNLPNNSLAVYQQQRQRVGWNLHQVEAYLETLQRLAVQKDVSDREYYDLIEFLIYTGSHEYQHRLEEEEVMFTHNRAFYEGQRKILETIGLQTSVEDAIQLALALYPDVEFTSSQELARLIAK